MSLRYFNARKMSKPSFKIIKNVFFAKIAFKLFFLEWEEVSCCLERWREVSCSLERWGSYAVLYAPGLAERLLREAGEVSGCR